MNLTWKAATLEQNLNSILQLVPERGDSVWMEGLYHFYPEISKNDLLARSGAERKDYLSRKITRLYEEKSPVMIEKQADYQAHWDQYRGQVTEALSESFSLDCAGRFENMTGYITLNPVCPRDLKGRTFDVFFLNSHRGALGMALHEIIHFVWFDRWQALFQDDPAGYERPHLPWILSEMAVEPIMRDRRLSQINPYFSDGGCVYECFYTMKIQGQPILETLNRLYSGRGIEAFMKDSLDFCRRHEKEIRGQMSGYL